MSTRTVNVALLVCDTPRGKVLEENGNYHKIFSTWLQASTSLGSQFNLDPFDVVHAQEYPSDDNLQSYDGVMITGSAASAYEQVEWIDTLVAYVARILETAPHLRIIGICFGHQIVARAMGGECVPNGGRWEIGPTPLDLTDLGKTIFGGVDSLFIQQMHRDHVPVVPAGLELLGSTAITPNQGMVGFYDRAKLTSNVPTSLQDVHVLTVQGHPEFTERIVTALIESRTTAGIIDEKTAANAEKRRFWRNDGVSILGKTIWDVLSTRDEGA